MHSNSASPFTIQRRLPASASKASRSSRLKACHRRLAALCLMVVLAFGACALAGCQKSSPEPEEGASPYTHLEPDAAQELIESDADYVLVDVRQPLDYQYEHIAGAVNIPEDTLVDVAEEQLPDKDQTIIVYCDYGGVSKTAADELVEMGYTNVIDFDGMSVWEGETVRDESIQ